MNTNPKNNLNVKINSRINYFLLVISVFFISSCALENDVYSPIDVNVPENKVRLMLNTNAGDFTAPTLRAAADENNITEDIWVFVFEGNQISNAIFKEVVKATVSQEGTFAVLTKTDENCYVVAVANAPAEFYHGENDEAKFFTQSDLELVLTGRNITEIEDFFLTKLLVKPSVTCVPYIGECIPMAGISSMLNGIKEETVISNSDDGKFYLKRIVAKADITSTCTNFEFMGATVVNVPCFGTFFRTGANLCNNQDNLTHYLASSGDKVCDISSAVWDNDIAGYTTCLSPLYMYESGSENKTSIIIKGKYNNTEYYYNLGFIDASNNTLDILRNKHYKFEITSVASHGETSIDAAMSALSSNIKYNITVLDDISHDLVSNGNYYLGGSNSELVIYGEGTQQGIIAFTVNTDATLASGITVNTVTSEGNGLTLQEPGYNGAINLATSSSVSGTTDVKIALSSSFVSGSIIVRLGNLEKNVKITRRPALSYIGTEAVEGSFVSGVITRKGQNEEWLSLSTDGTTIYDEDKSLLSPGTFYIMAPSNISLNGGSNRIGGEFFLSRNSEEGRTKFIVSQSCLNTGEIITTPYGYVGAFWRADQTGERLIRIPYINGCEGTWTAFVLAGEDWIKLDTEESKDPNIGWKNNSNESSVADMNNTGNDAFYQVDGDVNTVNGLLENGGNIYFRIGLKSKYQSTAGNPARYGVVLLSYNNNSKFSKIYVRQGESADYLMRPNNTNSAGNGWGSPARPLAKKFVPYNLTAPAMTSGGNQNYLHPHIDLRTGAFTKYPTQTGAFLQYANNNNQRFAYHPVNPSDAITGWQDNYASGYWSTSLIWSHETCPSGWRRPNDGPANAATGTSANVINSEIRQSLYYNPQDGTISNMDNIIFGYYADGFFDRRKIVASPSGTPSSAVSVENYNIAYAGYLFFNPYDNGSLFFPVSGRRSNSNGSLQLTGNYCAYWSVTTSSDQAYAWALTFDQSLVYQYQIKKSEAVSIRCIKDE